MMAAGLAVLTVAPARSASRDWPPYLPASDEYPGQIARAITRLWRDPTFTREVRAAPAPVPPAFYLRFVDAPDLTAAAARHLGLAHYDVELLGDDWYEADDHDGAHGVYRVLLREGGRRVILSWGTHRGSILGAVAGSALTRLEFSNDAEGTAQRLGVHVIIDNAVAAGLTRTMLPMFGWLVDHKLTQGFRTTSRVAAWAHDKPDEFCAWLRGVLTPERRTELAGAFEACGRDIAVTPRGSAARSDGRASGPPAAGERPPAP